MSRIAALTALVVMTSASGVLAETPATTGTAPTAPPVGAWPKPVVLPVKMPPSGASQDWTQLSMVWGKGLVGGTPDAVSSIGQPLAGLEGGSRVLDACKKAVWDQASQSGAESIEAMSQAPDRRVTKGRVFAPVTMRLSYAKPTMFEVRKSTVICVVNRNGGFVDAYTPDAGYRTASPGAKPVAGSAEWSRLSAGRHR